MTKLTTERLETIATWREKYGNGANVMIPAEEAELMARRILAYDQAAKNPVASCWSKGGILQRDQFIRYDVSSFPDGEIKLFAAPVLPKQPEHHATKLDLATIKLWNWNAKITMGETEENCEEWIAARAILSLSDDLLALLAQPVIPEQKIVGWIFEDELPKNYPYDAMFVHSKVDVVRMFPVFAPSAAHTVIPEQNKFRDLSQPVDPQIYEYEKAQQNEPQNIPENIPVPLELRYGDNVLWFLNELASFDASDIDSDDFDVYGEDRNGTEGCTTISITELAADAAKLLSAQPVSEPYKLPQGYALVPCKLTAENGAKSCMIGKFIEQTEISCPECFGDDECETCDGSGTIEVTAHVSWTTIKDIWAKGIEHFAAAPAQESK
ncbi:hypothetical protein [Hafnia paralvei]|uniref:hypothetical protein n=1 Tax=Hafnia paralvei TaxID=546367 RepID=UPI001D12C17F|nr:hypothetical protein [Hafnia paralvei]